MTQYEAGDYVKAEFKDEETGESEWMWVHVESSDNGRRIVFGTLDSEPVVRSDKFRLGHRIAVSYDNIRQHKKAWEFTKQ